MSSSRYLFAIGLALSLSAGALPASAACPENTLWYTDAGIMTNRPSAQVDYTQPDGLAPWSTDQPCDCMCYNLPKGTFRACGSGTPWGSFPTFMRAYDDYTIVGPAHAEPFSFVADLHVTGTNADGAVIANVEENEAYSSWYSFSDPVVDEHVYLPLQKSVGEIFRLAFVFGASAGGFSGTSNGLGRLQFSGLPVGYSIVSCQQFDVPVGTVPTTWSRLKATYR